MVFQSGIIPKEKNMTCSLVYYVEVERGEKKKHALSFNLRFDGASLLRSEKPFVNIRYPSSIAEVLKIFPWILPWLVTLQLHSYLGHIHIMTFTFKKKIEKMDAMNAFTGSCPALVHLLKQCQCHVPKFGTSTDS